MTDLHLTAFGAGVGMGARMRATRTNTHKCLDDATTSVSLTPQAARLDASGPPLCAHVKRGACGFHAASMPSLDMWGATTATAKRIALSWAMPPPRRSLNRRSGNAAKMLNKYCLERCWW